jgi:3-(3-hydroxy-phenyl)propionate hydroxylase
VAKVEKWEAAFIVGADGASSFTRRNLGIKYERCGAVQEFDVFEFESERQSNEVRVVLDADLTNVLWTLPGARQRWTFQVENAGSAHREAAKSRLLMQLPGDSSPKHAAKMLTDLITARAPWFDSEPGDIAWSGDVRFEQRLASNLGKGRAWLVGDAAHQTGPVGVQSMNAGLVEARELARRIADTLRAKGGPERLIDYEASVQKRWRQLLGQKNALGPSETADGWVRAQAARIVPCIPATDADLLAAAAQLGLVPTT